MYRGPVCTTVAGGSGTACLAQTGMSVQAILAPAQQQRDHEVDCLGFCGRTTWEFSGYCNRCATRAPFGLDLAMKVGGEALRNMPHAQDIEAIVVMLDELLTGALGNDWHLTEHALRRGITPLRVEFGGTFDPDLGFCGEGACNAAATHVSDIHEQPRCEEHADPWDAFEDTDDDFRMAF